MAPILSNFFSSKHNGPRKVIDLIHKHTQGLFANMEPTSPIAVGDYGTLGEDTGRFTIAGNIYTDFAMEEYGIPKAVKRDPEDRLIVLSPNGTRKDDTPEDGPYVDLD